jgi:hypothetical protein
MNAEEAACTPISINPNGFNVAAELPYGLQIDHIHAAMTDFIDFIGFINAQATGSLPVVRAVVVEQ